jgi:hypothetical protein
VKYPKFFCYNQFHRKSLQDVKTDEIPLFHVGTEEYKFATLQRVTLLFVDWGTSKAEYSHQIQSRGHTNKFLTKESRNAMTTVLITQRVLQEVQRYFWTTNHEVQVHLHTITKCEIDTLFIL